MNQATQSVSDQANTVKLKYGTIREDGMVFVCYQNGGKEYWVTPEKFAIKREKANERLLKRRKANPEAFKEKSRQWRLDNPEKYKDAKAKYRQNNLERIREEDRLRAASKRKNNPQRARELEKARYERDKEKRAALTKEWVKNNREKLNATNRAKFKRYRETNPLFALSSRLRSRLLHVIEKMGISKKSSTSDILGCDWGTLKSHIESKFTAKMSWENRHLWEIDHIVPLGSATTEEEVLKLSVYTNLQPLWTFVNNAKGDLMPEEWAKISHLYTDYIPEELA